MKYVLIYSGGMDSTVALYHLVNNYSSENVLAVSFDYNSKHNDEEYKRAKKTCKELEVELTRINLKSISMHLNSNLLKGGEEIPEGHYAESSMKKTVVPFRNGIMLSVACAIAESIKAEKVVIGNHIGDHAIYPDCRATFIDAFSEAMQFGTYNNVSVMSPFCSVTKTDIAAAGEAMNVNWLNTYSCYKGGEIHCGRCSTCFERREAFFEAGIEDLTEYLDKTPFKDLASEYNERLND